MALLFTSNIATPDQPAISPGLSRSALWRLLWLCIAMGVACRLSQFLRDTSYWRDEAYILLNVLHKSVAQLFGRLDYDQTAPPLFLAIERLVAVHLGHSELLMRLPPQLCGI